MTRPAAPAVYDAVAFDLFGTLIEFDPGLLPTLMVDGVPVPSTVPRIADLLPRYVPGVTVGEFFVALRGVTEAIRVEHRGTLAETPSRERFRRVLEQVGCTASWLDEAAVVLARQHHAGIADATVFPPSRRAVLDAAARRGPVVVVSNFDDTASAMAILARHGILPSLATVVVSEAVGLRKPHPATLVAALTTLAIPAAATLFVGDNFEADVGVAHAVGAEAAWIDARGRGVPEGARRPRYVLRTLEELHDALGT